MAVADRALWTIERNLARTLSLEEIAAACGVSRSHLAYAFGTSTGLPVMKYLRGRRLTEAARALVGGAPDILTVALDTGYSSHEAFTRAFKEQFATTPEAIRDRGSLDGVALVDPLAWKATDTTVVGTPHIEKEDALVIVGLSELCSFDSVVKIPGLWQRFMSQYYAAIPAKVVEIPVGASYAAGDEGGFQYVCGVEVARVNSKPKELVILELPARCYAVFEHREHVSRLTEAYRKIWNEALPALGRVVADAPILERFNQGFDTRTGEGGVQLWIPLEQDRSGKR
jgi:AraC family transcriptional regulator